MLPKKFRLSRSGFARMRAARRAASEHFSLSYTERAKISGATVVVPKKAVPTAVGRNRMKRKIRPLLLPYVSPTRSLAVYVRPGAGQVPFPALKKELLELLDSVK